MSKGRPLSELLPVHYPFHDLIDKTTRLTKTPVTGAPTMLLLVVVVRRRIALRSDRGQ